MLLLISASNSVSELCVQIFQLLQKWPPMQSKKRASLGGQLSLNTLYRQRIPERTCSDLLLLFFQFLAEVSRQELGQRRLIGRQLRPSGPERLQRRKLRLFGAVGRFLSKKSKTKRLRLSSRGSRKFLCTYQDRIHHLSEVLAAWLIPPARLLLAHIDMQQMDLLVP